MKDLFFSILEAIIGKDVIERKVNIRMGMLIVLMVMCGVITFYVNRTYWQWNHVKQQVGTMSEQTSNIVNNVIEADFGTTLNTIQAGVQQSELNEVTLSQQISHNSDTLAKQGRQLDRLDDYMFDKMGVKLDFNEPVTNSTTLDP